MDKAKNRMRIRLANLMMALTALGKSFNKIWQAWKRIFDNLFEILSNQIWWIFTKILAFLTIPQVVL